MIKFEQNIKRQHQCALAFVDGRMITSPGLAIGTCVETDFYRSMIKMIEIILNEDYRMLLKNTATQDVLHHTTISNFLDR